MPLSCIARILAWKIMFTNIFKLFSHRVPSTVDIEHWAPTLQLLTLRFQDQRLMFRPTLLETIFMPTSLQCLKKPWRNSQPLSYWVNAALKNPYINNFLPTYISNNREQLQNCISIASQLFPIGIQIIRYYYIWSLHPQKKMFNENHFKKISCVSVWCFGSRL